MSNFTAVVGSFSLLLAPDTTFSDVLANATLSDQAFAEQQQITDWESYFGYMRSSKGDKDEGEEEKSLTTAIFNIPMLLQEEEPEYYWIKNEEKSAETMDVSNAIPVEMQSEGFYSDSELNQAILLAEVSDETSYGGCGPIAMIGILDYFSRYLGYDELIQDPTDSLQRIQLAKEVLEATHFSFFGNQENTLVWPWDARDSFNAVIENHGLDDILSAQSDWTLFLGHYEDYWPMVVESIDKGIPTTLFVGYRNGNGSFAQHYTNIYGYETWTGIPRSGTTGEQKNRTFLKARLNGGDMRECYCNATILECAQVGLITYDLKPNNSYSFQSDEFTEYFVNSEGEGYYNPTSRLEFGTLDNGIDIMTERLRTGYFEDQYLLLSPNRAGAGNSYLTLSFPHDISRLSFKASVFSRNEYNVDEEFRIQYFRDGTTYDHIEIDLNSLGYSILSAEPIDVLFPKGTRQFTFSAIDPTPAGNEDRGRIQLESFAVEYN